jgi:hypothetical protein
MRKFTVSLAAVAMFVASPVLAMGELPPGVRPPPRGGVHSVPEIDASAGLLALGAVALLLLLVWERRRHVAKKTSARAEQAVAQEKPRAERSARHLG